MARDLGGATLGLASETGFPTINGVDAAVLAYSAFGADQALRIVPLPDANTPMGTWALGLDLYVPQPTGSFVSLLQTGDGDGDLFLRDNGDGTAGIGINGSYSGAIPFDDWVRLFITVTEETTTTILRTYVNGTRVSERDVGADPRFDIDPASGLKLLTDNDGETAPGALAGVFFTSELPSLPETEGAIASVANPNAAGFFPVQPSPAALEITFDGEDVAPKYGEARVALDGFAFENPNTFGNSAIARASQFGIEGPGGADIPVLDYAAFSAQEGLKIDVPSADLSTFTAVWDIRVDRLDGFQSLLQLDPAQTNDGELFIRADGGIGINGNYDGTLVPGTWHRIAITVDDQGDGTSLLSKYLDGVFLDTQTVDTARFTLRAENGALLLSDNDGETGTGYLAHFGLTAGALDAAAIAALGGADGKGPFEAGTPITLTFDSSFRPYADMTGDVLVSFDGGAFTSLLTLDASTVAGGNSSLARINETISLDVLPPAGTSSVQFRFDYTDADNDWWWAIDNIAITEGGTLLLEEDFDDLSAQLQSAVDENIAPDVLGWTQDAPEGWDRTVDAPQGTTEWQGWSFATPEFWLTADNQNRDAFTLGTGIVAIADGDEWDDFNDGSQTGNDFNTALTTPQISLGAPAGDATFQLGFDGYAPKAEFGFSSVALLEPEANQGGRQDNIKDMLIRDDGTPTEIDLLAVFGPNATDFEVTTGDGSVLDAAIAEGVLTLSAQMLGHADITVTAQTPNGPLEENFRAIVAGENAYVFAIIPDTQDYTSNLAISQSFGTMTDWIVAQKDSLAIEHAIHVGDIVQFGATGQWDIAKEAMERLDGEVSYSLAIGNHDQQRPGFASAFSFETDVDTYFTPEQVGATRAQGGGTYDGVDVGADTFNNGNTYAESIRNAYTTFETRDGTNWLVFSLEFGMPDDVLRWAGGVIEDHLDHRVIINTHSWQGGDGRVTPTTEPLNTDNGGWGYAIRDNPRNVNDGEDAWRDFASKYPNITFTFNGHNFMGGAETTVSYAAGGNPVFQTFVNYQGGANGNDSQGATNNGTLRLVVIDPDNDRYTTHTKITELDTFYNEFPDHEEVFEGVKLGAPEHIVIAKAEATQVIAGDGISGTVTLDPGASLGDTTGALFEWFAADGEKLGESDGAVIEVDLPTGTTRISLKVTDAAGNVSTDDTVVIVETPAPEAPLVIAHRGASADRPEHTLAAYQLAMERGADFVEPDLVSTQDGVLVARHEPWLATVQTDADGNVVLGADGFPVVTFASTDIAELAKTNADFMARLTTKNIGFSSEGLFGPVTGWFVEDFTLAELKTLRAVEDQPDLRPQSAAFDGLFDVPTLAEIIQLVKDFEADTGRQVGIYPETKEPSYFDSIGLSLEEKLIATLQAEGFTDPARVFIQSFEVANLLDLQDNIMPDAGVDLPLVQLLFNAPNFPTFDLLQEALTGGDFSDYARLGYDAGTVSGDFITPEGLAKLAEIYAEGVGPSFGLVQGGEGFTDLVHDAQSAGLQVHAYTHRNESGQEYETFLASGVDGIFTDNPETGRAATDAARAAIPRLTETFDDGDLVGWGAPAGDPDDLAELGTDLGFALPSIGGVAQIPLSLRFDSSFRPYDDMTGEVLVSFDDGATFSTLLTLDTSTVPGGSSSLARVNEAIELQTLAPNSAQSAQFAFRLSQAGNDWWWAIDNVEVDGPKELQAIAFWSEDFDGLTGDLQSAVDEAIDSNLLGWTQSAPSGWSRTVDAPRGTTEWQGWSFATPEFWLAADRQGRELFSKGTGVIAIADGDEWDDFNDGSQTGNDFNTVLTTDVISLTDIGTDAAPVDLRFSFDSSFRPYADMTGEVLVSFDGGDFTSLLTLDTSTVPGGASALTRVNETIALDVTAPQNATVVQFRFDYRDADNDWWWAIDNLSLATLEEVAPTLLLESFDALPLQPAVDEAIDPTLLGWTPTPPADWKVNNAEFMPQGTTEWQGWTFATPTFWTTADGQNRSDFTSGTGVIAIADPDEWADFGIGASGGDFDSTLRSPAIDLTPVGGGQPAGRAAGIARIDALAPDAAILFRPDGLSGPIDSYTLVFDILLSPTTQSFTGLFQTDLSNSGDAEIYLRNDGTSASIGISSDYDGALDYGQWGRLGLVFETDETGQQTLFKYLDGTLLDTQVVDDDVSNGSRWSFDGEDGILLFSEGAGFTSEIFTNAVYFAPEALEESVLGAFGGVDVDGPADGSRVAGDVQLSFDTGLDDTDFGAATVEALSLASPESTSYLVKGSIFGNPNKEGEAALYQQSNQIDQDLIWLDPAARGWSDYVFTMVVEPADNDTIGALFYYTDADTHYKLEIDQQNDTRSLIRVKDGDETVLASEAGGYRHFAEQDLSIAVHGETITITLDDDLLFDGPVVDTEPLEGGTVGITSSSMDRVAFDNITVNPITLAARALTEEPWGKWSADVDADGISHVSLTAAASLSAQGIAKIEWLVDGDLVATGAKSTIALTPGDATVTLRIIDTKGAVAEDRITLAVADNRALLLHDDFSDGNAMGWTFIDEGTLGGPSDWQVVGDALVQASDIGSPQQGTGSRAYSVDGDGPYILRDGTYALWQDPDALGWANYAVEATLTPNDNDGIGLLFRYTDADNYYKMETDAQTGIAMLTRHLDGRESILARGYVGYTEGKAQHWRIEAEGGVLTPYIDGKAVFGSVIEDRTLPVGTVGLYGWSSEGLTFDDIVVTQLDFVPVEDLNLIGDGDDNTLIGQAGDDTILMRWGDDMATGADGADTFVIDARYVTAGDTHQITDLDFAEGDKVDFRFFDAPRQITSETDLGFYLTNGFAVLNETKADGSLTVTFQNLDKNFGAQDDSFVGTADNDVFDGGAGADLFLVRYGSDTITGGADADTFLFDGRYVGGDSTHVITDLDFSEGDALLIRFFDGHAKVNVTSQAGLAALDDLDFASVTETVTETGIATELTLTNDLGESMDISFFQMAMA